MENEQTNKTDTGGVKDNPAVEDAGIVNPILSEAKELAQRIEAGNKETKELQKKEEQLLAEKALSGTSGGHVEAEALSEEDQKIETAADFFKGTELENAIRKSGKK